MKNIITAITLLVILTSCVSNKRTTYLQGSLSEKKYDFPHQIFKTQVNDILLIKIKSKDEELMSFFNSLSASSASQASSNVNPYFEGYRIDQHGNIRLPYIGELNVLGFSLDNIRKKIENELSKYIQNSNSYFITVKNAGIKYTIVGEIGSPGTNNIQAYEATIVDAIANSGDISEYGNRTNVEVIRQEEDGVKKYIIDLTSIESLNSDVFLLKNNDIINIQPIKQKPIGIGTTGLSVFSTVLSTLTIIFTTILFINSL